MKRISLLLIAFSVVFVGCAAYVGRAVDVPEIPSAVKEGDARARLSSSIAVGEIRDAREVPEEGSNYTEPAGDVASAVKSALERTLTDKGMILSLDAPVTVTGEVREWRSSVSARTTSQIQSEAALAIEVRDPSNKKLYSGVYHGSRSSQFPVASAGDVQDSLGLAMSQAIAQMLQDKDLLNVISSY